MFKDFSAKIADITRLYTREREYWLKQLSGELARSAFPYRHPGREVQTGAEAVLKDKIEFKILGRPFSRLQELSRGSDPTLHVILTAALTVLLGKYTGNRDIILGVPVYRQEQEADFVNTVLALRNPLEPGASFKQLLLQVKDTLLEAHDHQNYPLEKLAEELAPGSVDPDEDFPLFDVSLLLENLHDKCYIQHIRHNIAFSFRLEESLLAGSVAYNSSRYPRSQVEQIVGHFSKILDIALFDLDLPLSRLDLLSETERKEFLSDFNRTETGVPNTRLIHECFAGQAEQTPEQIAVSDREQLSYRELHEQSDRLAAVLREKGVLPDTIVGLKLERSPELIVGILGILKAGGAYLPIDPAYPEERTHFMLNDSNAKIRLTQQEITGYSSPQGASFHPPQSPESGHRPPATSLAYVIYTSGTTGNPRGVMVSHQGVVNYVQWAAQTYVKNETAAFPLYTSTAFDLTVTSVFVPLFTGSTIYIYNGEEGEFLIDKVLEDNRVEVVKLTPAHLKLVKERNIFPAESRVKRFILGGENLETRLAHDILAMRAGDIEIYNEYGPTETVVGSMIHCFDPEQDRGESVSIGKPIANTQVYLLDRDGNPVPPGVPGEICIGGAGVARGYLNRPELTAEKFCLRRPGTFLKKGSWTSKNFLLRNNQTLLQGVQGGGFLEKNPPGRRRQKLYKTGDLACRQLDGTIEFLGRLDHQVKIRGHRVELGEIEFHLKHFKKQEHTVSILEEKEVAVEALKNVTRCRKCLVSVNYPGSGFDAQGVCRICREYESYEQQVKNYFKTPPELAQWIEANKSPGSPYDCLLLFSGGKDSTYVLYRLIDMGLKVLTYTFDNGYISASAFENIKRTTAALKVDHLVGKAEHMNRVFVESLESNHSVCHGCWNALNAYGTKLAQEQGINVVVSGLSRGQIFEMRLHGLFRAGIFNEEEIAEKLLLFRKGFHSKENKFARLLDMNLDETAVEQIRFVDYFRYDNTKVAEIKTYLSSKGWEPPQDTGFCSSNCRINDVGIYMHLKEQGVHFYEAPLSWDVRLGQITRETGLREIGFRPEPPQVDQVLREIGYYRSAGIKDALVLAKKDKHGNTYLCGYIVSDSQLAVRELREYLAARLPAPMIPSYFVQVERIPLTAGGKVDRKALLNMETEGQRLKSAARYIPPAEEKEIRVTNLFKELLNLDRVGIEDNFFELGATSFEIIQVSRQLSGELGKEIPVIKLFEYPTTASLLAYLQGEEFSPKEAETEARWDESRERGKSRFEQRRKMRR